VEEAVAAYRAALEEEFTRERVPLQWAATQTGLGLVLFSLGERAEEARKLEEAREAVSGAFAVYMESGQEHLRSDFENLLREIDDSRARLQATLKAR
jgi:hypothetical protein